MRKLLSKLWASPTFTSWGNYAVQSSRLLLVTPLILTRFNESEIAAWYLFASLNFLGLTLSQRLSLTFSRMLAYAMGGANTLAPIIGNKLRKVDQKPNWAIFERAYGVIGTLNLGTALINILAAVFLGWIGLKNLTIGSVDTSSIYVAFGVMQVSTLFLFCFQRYQIALIGMNYVALSNRVNMVFSLFSIAAGALTLWFGGGLLSLVVVMQSFVILGIGRNWYLLRSVEGGRVLMFAPYRYDREIVEWAWGPTWKGFIGQFGLNGAIQLTAVLYASYASKLEVASFLFASRIMQTIVQIAQAPFGSVQPKLARLLGGGDNRRFAELTKSRIYKSMLILVILVILSGVLLPPLLNAIDSNINFIGTLEWFVFGALIILIRANVLCISVFAIGNEMFYYWDMAIAAISSLFVIIIIKSDWGVYSPILASTVPLALILNIRPFIKVKKYIKEIS